MTRGDLSPSPHVKILHYTHNALTLAFLFLRRIKIDIHFSLIAAAVTYIMWKSVGEDKIKKMEGKKIDDGNNKKRRGYWRVDCQSASKGKSNKKPFKIIFFMF